MKVVPVGLQASYEAGSSTLCTCLKIERRDGDVARFTSADHDVVIDNADAVYDGTYLSAPGLMVSNLVSQSGLAVDNMELAVVPDDVTYPQPDILSGRWDSAKFRLFKVDYTDTTLGVDLLKRGTTGEADITRTSDRFEFRSLKQAYQQSIAAVTQKTCRARLGDEGCKVDLAPLTFDYTITAVDLSEPRRVFTVAAATQDPGWFKEGSVQALDGENDGQNAVKVKDFASGVFELSLDAPYIWTIGDTVRAITGCQKRHARKASNPGGISDCIDKFDNVLNFQGEPDVPGADILTADPEVSV